MHALASPVSSAPASLSRPAAKRPEPWSGFPMQRREPDVFVTLIRNHHRAVFHLAHALLRDEVAAEKITQQVFSRAQKRMDLNPAAISEWIYYASFRFVRMYHWRSAGLLARRRMHCGLFKDRNALDLKMFVSVIAHQPGKLEPRDCELLALRHVVGMPLATISHLLRMHPYEVSNRLAWALERVTALYKPPVPEIPKPADLAMSA
jgi:DNA-directed RNA polymerase specialized sigma24 family protein